MNATRIDQRIECEGCGGNPGGCAGCGYRGWKLLPPGTDYPISYSALKSFIDSIAVYEGRYVSGDVTKPDSSETMQFGKLLHVLVLEPGNQESKIAIEPQSPKFGRTKAEQEAKGEWERTVLAPWRSNLQPEQVVVTEAEFDLASAMRDAAYSKHLKGSWRYPAVVEALSARGEAEKYVEYCDSLYGILLQATIDKDSAEIIFDLKSTKNPNPIQWVKDAANFGYYLQDAFTRRILAGHGRTPEFDFIVCGKLPPYEWGVFRFDTESKAVGDREVDEALREVSGRIHQADWTSRLAHRQEVSLPPWKKRR
jgi:hypothetical protein